jgi:hypothetical protein
MFNIGWIWRWLKGDWWTVRESCWPHAVGYATYNSYRRTVMDTGLIDKEYAQMLCDDMNSKHRTTKTPEEVS